MLQNIKILLITICLVALSFTAIAQDEAKRFFQTRQRFFQLFDATMHYTWKSIDQMNISEYYGLVPIISNEEGLDDSSQNANEYKFLISFLENVDDQSSGLSKKMMSFEMSDLHWESLQEIKQVDNSHLTEDLITLQVSFLKPFSVLQKINGNYVNKAYKTKKLTFFTHKNNLDAYILNIGEWSDYAKQQTASSLH